ncbi:MAG TPA: pyridoxamine 5'-phosphate oxidase family protein [Gemmatimonadales bacterium]
MTRPATTFRALTQHECVLLLRRSDVGRLAFVADGRPEIVPLNYVHEAGRIYGRTSASAKLAALAEGAWVAFEVDEIRGRYDWWSVVIHGTFHRIGVDCILEGVADGDGSDAASIARAIGLLRAMDPVVFTTEDPTPHRTLLFRIVVGTMSGRMASTGPPGKAWREDEQ